MVFIWVTKFFFTFSLRTSQFCAPFTCGTGWLNYIVFCIIWYWYFQINPFGFESQGGLSPINIILWQLWLTFSHRGFIFTWWLVQHLGLLEKSLNNLCFLVLHVVFSYYLNLGKSFWVVFNILFHWCLQSYNNSFPKKIHKSFLVLIWDSLFQGISFCLCLLKLNVICAAMIASLSYWSTIILGG